VVLTNRLGAEEEPLVGGATFSGGLARRLGGGTPAVE
jgi:hypothetical protein